MKSTFDARFEAPCTVPGTSAPAPSGMLLVVGAEQPRKAQTCLTRHASSHRAGGPRGSCQAGEDGTWDQAGSPPNTEQSPHSHTHSAARITPYQLLPPSQTQPLSPQANPGRTSIISHLYSCDSLQPRPSDLPSTQSHLPSAQILVPSPMTSPLPTPAPPVTALKVVCKCASLFRMHTEFKSWLCNVLAVWP